MTWITDRMVSPFGKPIKVKKGELCYVSGTRRCMGTLVDLVIMVLVLQLIHGAFFLAFPRDEAAFKAIEKHKLGISLNKEEKILRNKYIYRAVVLQTVQLVAVFMYNVYMWVHFSATVGKFLVGLRVIDEGTMGEMTLGQATKRFFSIPLSGVPLGLGIFWSNFDARKRTWHDMIAKTVVVTKKSLEDCRKGAVD
ncbi:MAG: RDD family protein [Anaplasma sp.]